MGEQKNLFLAIGLSVAIIVVFQLLCPQQTAMAPPENKKVEELQTTTSFDDNEIDTNRIIKTKEEVIASDNRILINTPSLKGSINLKGAVLDDLILLNYYETLEENSKNITLFYPDGTANPYFIEFEWKAINKIDTEFLEIRSHLPETISRTIKATKGGLLEFNKFTRFLKLQNELWSQRKQSQVRTSLDMRLNCPLSLQYQVRSTTSI